MNHDLTRTVADLAARVEALEAENERLRTHTDATPARPASNIMSRRNLLRLGGAAAATATGAVMLRPGVAHAAGGDNFVIGQSNDAGTDQTVLTSSNEDATLQINTTGNGCAIRARRDGGDGPILAAFEQNGTGLGVFVGTLNADNDSRMVWAETGGTGEAILGRVRNAESSANAVSAFTDGTGNAVQGAVSNTTATGAAVDGLTNGTGPALQGATHGTGHGLRVTIDNPNNNGRGALIVTNGKYNAINGLQSNTASTASSVYGRTNGSGAGIEGVSDKGEGGRFSGKTAQIRLMPSSAATHLAWGVPGQLFVDKNNRLWFCKGSLVWKLLA